MHPIEQYEQFLHIDRFFDDKEAEKYAKWAIRDDAFNYRMIKSIVFVDKMKPEKVIDIGCGTGTSTNSIINMYGPEQVVGVDFSIPMLMIARRKLKEHRGKVQLYKKDIKDMTKCAGQSADAVVAHSTFDLLGEDITDHLVAIHNVLKSDGVLSFDIEVKTDKQIVHYPLMYALGHVFDEVRGSAKGGTTKKEPFFDKETIESKLNLCGFEMGKYEEEKRAVKVPEFMDYLHRTTSGFVDFLVNHGFIEESGRDSFMEMAIKYTDISMHDWDNYAMDVFANIRAVKR